MILSILVLSIAFAFFILIVFNFYTLLSLKSKHPQNGVFKKGPAKRRVR